MENGVIEIKQCPVCGSTRRYVEEMTKREIEDGRVRPGARFCTHIFRNNVLDQSKANELPFGAQIPVYEVWVDVCLGYPDKPCGCIYAVKLKTGTATKEHKLVMPGAPPGGSQKFPFSTS